MRKISSFWIIPGIFVILKLSLHLFTFSNYELHRDALLYYSLGENLDWGYVSVPPLIALFSAVSTHIFGNTIFALRLFPLLTGAASIIIISFIIKEIKGGKIALITALLAFLLSPAFLRSNSLFQPVTFNQFFWLLSGYLLIRLINTENRRLWIFIFMVWGLAFLNKYSIVFFMAASIAGLLLTSKRNLIFSGWFITGGMLALIIISPNIYWQISHNWPVIHHMQELQRMQFVHVSISGFILDQFMMNLPGIIVWMSGLIMLLFIPMEKKFRAIGFLYLAVILFLIALHGKSYYTLGVYPILFAFGGYAIERYMKPFVGYVVAAFTLLIAIPLIPFSLPVMEYPILAEYSKPTAEFTNRWEDGKVYSIPQDFADMTGWNELAVKTIKYYQTLPDSVQQNCAIYTENYGQAGALRFYGKSKGMPAPVCFNDNFLLWAPDSLNTDYLIYINDEVGDIDQLFGKYEVVDAISNPYFRERDLKIYFCSQPDSQFFSFYQDKVFSLKSRYTHRN